MWKLISAAVNRLVMRSYEEAATGPPRKAPVNAASPRQPEKLTRQGIEQQFQRAVELLQAGNKAAAQEAIHLAVKRAAIEQQQSGPIYAEALAKEAIILCATGELARAAAVCRSAVDVPAESDSAKRDRLAYQMNLADILTRLGRLDDAEQVLRDNLAEQRDVLGAENPEYANGLAALAELLLIKGQAAAALELIDQAVQVLSAAGHERLPIVLALRAYIVKAAHGPDAPGLEAWPTLPRDAQAALMKQCLARANQADAKIAGAVLLELRRRMQSRTDVEALALLEVNIALAKVARASGDHDLRLDACRQTIDLCDGLKDRGHLVMARQELAVALDEAGRNDEVPTAYDAAVQAARELDQPAILSGVLRNYAMWADRIGRRDQADELHRQAVRYGASCGDWAVHGRSTAAYGMFLRRVGRIEEARHMLQEALAHLPPSHPDALAAQDHLRAIEPP